MKLTQIDWISTLFLKTNVYNFEWFYEIEGVVFYFLIEFWIKMRNSNEKELQRLSKVNHLDVI